MKAVCHICEQTFDLCPVEFDEDSGVSGEGGGFSLIPEHPAVPGKKSSPIISSKTYKVVKVVCAGSFRPPKISLN